MRYLWTLAFDICHLTFPYAYLKLTENNKTMKTLLCLLSTVWLAGVSPLSAQPNPLWTQVKVRNYLPHMTVPEVEDLLTRTDMVLIPIGALEQHGNHLPIGTDIINGIESCKLVAQERDVLVAPILFAGQSPYHMGFAGTVTLSAETILQVHMEAVQSLIRHGFKRFMILNAHGGNRAITTLLVDQINQTTAGIAVDLGVAIRPFRQPSNFPPPQVFDRHGGVSETSRSMYYAPTLVNMDVAVQAELTLPPHLEHMLPQVIAGDPTALLVFLAEGLKAEETGKKTSSAEMSTTGVWGVRDLSEARMEYGKSMADRFVEASVAFIDRWNALRPFGTK